MDKKKWIEIYNLLTELVGENEPTDEELDYDDDAIEMYASAHNLKEAIENYGI